MNEKTLLWVVLIVWIIIVSVRTGIIIKRIDTKMEQLMMVIERTSILKASFLGGELKVYLPDSIRYQEIKGIVIVSSVGQIALPQEVDRMVKE